MVKFKKSTKVDEGKIPRIKQNGFRKRKDDVIKMSKKKNHDTTKDLTKGHKVKSNGVQKVRNLLFFVIHYYSTLS